MIIRKCSKQTKCAIRPIAKHLRELKMFFFKYVDKSTYYHLYTCTSSINWINLDLPFGFSSAPHFFQKCLRLLRKYNNFKELKAGYWSDFSYVRFVRKLLILLRARFCDDSFMYMYMHAMLRSFPPATSIKLLC